MQTPAVRAMQDPDGYMGGVWKSFADVMAIYRNKGPSVRFD